MRPSPADNRFVVAQRGERLDIEELDAAGLKQGGEVDRSVVGRENKRMQPGHLAGVERLLKFRGLSFFLCPVNFPALNSIAQRLLDRCQNLVAPFRLLEMLLIIVQPESGINADENEDQFSHPTAKPPEIRSLFVRLAHDSIWMVQSSNIIRTPIPAT